MDARYKGFTVSTKMSSHVRSDFVVVDVVVVVDVDVVVVQFHLRQIAYTPKV